MIETSKVSDVENASTVAPSDIEEDIEPSPPAYLFEHKLDAIEKEPARGQWSGKFDSLVCMINYAIGLGNVWRFPYLCFKHGGGAFLIPYFISWIFCACPIYYLEVCIGQYLQQGGLGIWKICPIFKGVGIANVVISCICATYYCVISAWGFFYVFSSFKTNLPWFLCNQTWTDYRCLEPSVTYDNTSLQALLTSRNLSVNEFQTSVEQFWENNALGTTPNIEITGDLKWNLVLLLTLCWVITYFALWRGITHSKIFIYLCALLPYLLLIILLGKSVTLDGAGQGVIYYLKPNMTKLLDATVWKDAGTQVFYSCGIGYGALMAIGSYNKFNHNCCRDCVIMCFMNAFTSISAGFIIFGVLGYMSKTTGKDIETVVKSGVGLAFLVYPEALGQMPVPQLWAVLFFVMIAVMGLNSQICMVEGLITALSDEFPHILREYKKLSVLVFCIVFWLLGFPIVTQSGQYWLALIDNYGASGTCVLFIVFFELVGIAYGFGTRRISAGIREMVGSPPNRLWYFGWLVSAPVLIAVGFFVVTIQNKPLKYADGTVYPTWALTLGLMMSLSSMIAIPSYAVYYLVFVAKSSSLKDKLREGTTPLLSITQGEDYISASVCTD